MFQEKVSEEGKFQGSYICRNPFTHESEWSGGNSLGCWNNSCEMEQDYQEKRCYRKFPAAMIEIQLQWTLVSVNIDDFELAQELLEEIAVTWLSIRSHALTRRWMETYKQSKKMTKKAKALRKDLKKKEKKQATKNSEHAMRRKKK